MNLFPYTPRLTKILLAGLILEKYSTKKKKLTFALYDEDTFGYAFEHTTIGKVAYPKISEEDIAALRELGEFRVNKNKKKYEEYELGIWVLWSNAD